MTKPLGQQAESPNGAPEQKRPQHPATRPEPDPEQVRAFEAVRREMARRSGLPHRAE